MSTHISHFLWLTRWVRIASLQICMCHPALLSRPKNTKWVTVSSHICCGGFAPSIYPSWNYISPNSHPLWLLVKEGLQEKFAQDLEDKREVSTLKVATKHQVLWQFIPVVSRVLAPGAYSPPARSPPPISSSPACLSVQSCPTLCDPMDYSPPGSSVSWIFQARILEWVAISFLQGIFLTQGLNLCLKCLLHWQTDSLSLAIWEAHVLGPLHMQIHDKGTHYFKTPRHWGWR